MTLQLKEFKKRIGKEGRSFRWFHRTYIKGLSYPYFIIQLNEPERMHSSVKKAIQKFLDTE